MKNLLLFCLLLQIVNCRAQYNTIKVNNDSIRSVTKEGLLNDLDEYADGIRRYHVSPYTHIKKRDFYDRIENIKKGSVNYDAGQILIQLLQLNAAIQDEHTSVNYLGRDIFPYGCYQFEEGIYIIQTTQDGLNLLYSRVIAVNSIPIKEVADRIATIEPTQNEACRKIALQRYLFDPFVIHGLLIAPSREDITYTLVTLKKDTIRIKPNAVDRRKLPLLRGFDPHSFLRYSGEATNWFRYIDSSKYVYFKYATCFDEKGNLVVGVIKKLKKTIDSTKPDKLVIDMRDNSGGYPELLDPFIEYLRMNRLNKKGNIYVLLGRKTFSAAIMNSTSLRMRTDALLIGEETGGDVQFFGGVKDFILPATKLMVNYSTQYWATKEKYEGSLRPDVTIPETFEDYSHGIDAALQYAITH